MSKIIKRERAYERRLD